MDQISVLAFFKNFHDACDRNDRQQSVATQLLLFFEEPGYIVIECPAIV